MGMLLPLAEEGEFLLLYCDTEATEYSVGDWVVPLWGPGDGDDGQDVCMGWILSFYPEAEVESDRVVEVSVEFLESIPAEVPANFSKVAEVSAAGPARLGASGEVPATADGNVAYRLRLLVDDSVQPVRLHAQSWPSEVFPPRVLRGATD